VSDQWWDESVREWRSGPWSIEVRDDEFADISYEGHVVLRSARAVVRDRNWDTPPLIVDRVDTSDLAVTLHVRCEELGADLRGIVRAEVRRPDRLVVLTDLESGADFSTNRTGLVVLHPPGLAGETLRIHHPGGDMEQTRFPAGISPHQPAIDIAGLAWNDAGLAVDLRFEGDVFEMEDQRNWTDASYKTYSRPLSLPFPYRLAAGERVVQTIAITVAGSAPAPADDDVVRIVLEPGTPFPAIAVSAASAPDPAPGVAAHGSAVIVELDLATRNWRAALERAASAGLPLDVRFVLADDNHTRITDGARALAGLPLVRVTAFWPTGPSRHVSDAAAIALLREALADAEVTADIVGGARSHFTELNREHHRLPDDLDGVVFSATPLFHSLSTAQLVESLPMQRLVATQAVEIAGGLPVHIGPISLRPHFNDVATVPPPMPQHDDLRAGYGSALTDAGDARLAAPEAAAWTVASAAALAVPGVATLAYFEEWGDRGIRASDGSPRPVAEAVTALAGLSGASALRGSSPDGLVWAVGARGDAGDTILVANLDRHERRVEVEVADGGRHVLTVSAGAFARL
jgi:D-apionolactonase